MAVARLPDQLNGGLVLLGALLATAACRPADACAESGAACGGDPSGNWVEVDVCQDPALQDAVAKKQTYRNQPIVPGGAAPPELTSTDWCAALVYSGPSGITLAGFPKDTPQIQGAYITYESDGRYTTFITGSTRASVTYSASCLQRFGYAPGMCEACPTTPPDPSCGIESSFGEAFKVYGSMIGGAKETACVGTGDGGCRCSYLTEGDMAGGNRSGIWSRNGNVITHFAGDGSLPTQVDYCVQGNQMTLWGHNRTAIFSLDSNGLRTLVLRKVVCGDGFTDRGEDCDPNDPMTSAGCGPTCTLLPP